ncbi:MAG: nuclear transport factor 2 family protein [Bacteroidetes bacterium]|nr:MAG: nuclear transport factor 2 family protein [Bacteroidota bacterium]
MKKLILLTITFALAISSLYGQRFKPDSIIIQEINDQLWEPFKTTYAAGDWEGFNALHTDDILRVSLWGGLRVGDEYKKSNEKSFQRNTETKRTIDFRFEHRIHNDSTAYEVGYYEITSTAPGKEPRNYYAQFHVRLKKEDGQWKISQDFDVDKINGRKITKEDYYHPDLTDLK